MSTSDDEFDETMTIDFYLPKRSFRQYSPPLDNGEGLYEALANNLVIRLTDAGLDSSPHMHGESSGFIHQGLPEDNPLLDLEESVLGIQMRYPYWLDDSEDSHPRSGSSSTGASSPDAPWDCALQPVLQEEIPAETQEATSSVLRPEVKKTRALKKAGKENKGENKKKATSRKHAGHVRKTVECELCHVTHNDDPRSTARHQRSAQHQQKIAGEGGQELPSLNCPQCGKVFTSRRQDSLKRHLTTCKGPDPVS